jgi:hypothetical protein
MFQSLDQFTQLIQRTLIFFREFKEHRGVGDFRFKLLVPLNGPLQAASYLQKLLGGVLVRPEIRRRSLRFDLV